MNKFIEVKASAGSLAKRKPICGIAINDPWYTTTRSVDGGQVKCPIYSIWRAMIYRCYDPKRQAKQPTYKGCTICNEWLTFSNFRSWVLTQDWEEMELDKDLKKIGNKVYSSENCLFISGSLNKLLTNAASSRGEWPIGVSFDRNVDPHLPLHV